MEVRYNPDAADRDIFLFLTEEDAHDLRSSGEKCILQTRHFETGMDFSLFNEPWLENDALIAAKEIKDGQRIRGVSIKISDKAYDRMVNGPEHLVMERVLGGSKVFIKIDEEMVRQLRVGL